MLLETFSNASAFKDSSVAKKLKEKFTTRKCKGYDYADVKEYECTAGVLVIFLVQWELRLTVSISDQGYAITIVSFECLFESHQS